MCLSGEYTHIANIPELGNLCILLLCSFLQPSSPLFPPFSCVFLPGSGAFFLVYVLTSGFIGTGVELLRIPELAYYLYYRATAKTRWQKEQALRKVNLAAVDRSSLPLSLCI